MRKKPRLRAIDLYSGVGGWSLGLRLAGIDVVASFELSKAANQTNLNNNGHSAETVDIRRLKLDKLPKSIDVVVGSPPCTQFSFANRGGNGDIDDGLTDIVKFLTIVDYLKPRFWAMENVPRVAKIIQDELMVGGRLRRFRHLGIDYRIVNMEQFGLPQRRTRCIAGNIPFELLDSYSRFTPKRTLGDVVRSLSGDSIRDPIYGGALDRKKLLDHVKEDPLNVEEERINRANKTLHPVYNSMPFPDSLSRSVRTITATCTRVCRESVVIRDPNKRTLRRLTLRERASLQGFPVTFQFYAETYAKKLKMIGNAVPPAFSYYVGHAIKNTKADSVPALSDIGRDFVSPELVPHETNPKKAGFRYALDRKFRFAVPALRLKSGVRFELVNEFTGDVAQWMMKFYFGTSKSIHSIVLDEGLYRAVINQLPLSLKRKVMALIERLEETLREADVARMQTVWTHRGVGRTTPFMLLDLLDVHSCEMIESLRANSDTAQEVILAALKREFGLCKTLPVGVGKLQRHAPTVLTGLLVGATVNVELKPVAKLVILPTVRESLATSA